MRRNSKWIYKFIGKISAYITCPNKCAILLFLEEIAFPSTKLKTAENITSVPQPIDSFIKSLLFLAHS